jgi:hypothetical protein
MDIKSSYPKGRTQIMFMNSVLRRIFGPKSDELRLEKTA